MQKTMRFLPPISVEVGGQFSRQTLTAPDSHMDVSLGIPTACLLQKDHLNHQYHAKRALYLATIAAELSKVQGLKKQRWHYPTNDPR